jgi:glycosyltransferase involved in cell wall biosynthesis
MRLLIASEYFPSHFKGYVDAQAAQFVEMGADVSFVALGRWWPTVDPRLAAVLPNPSITYLPESPSRPVSLARALAGAAGAPLRTAGLVRRLADAYGWRRRTLGDTVRGVILGAPDVDVCLVHDLSTLVVMRALPAALPGVPIVLWYHGAEVPGSKVLPPDEVAAVLPQVARVITNTEWSARHLAARGMPAEKIHVHRLGLDVDDFPRVSDRTFLPDGVLRLLFVGRLSLEKGLFDALEALARLDEAARARVHLRIVGRGFVENELAEAAKTLGLERSVTFVGHVERSQLNREFASADALLLPSRPVEGCEENQGMVVQEAMLTGLPVLTTAVGGLPEVVPPSLRELQPPPSNPTLLRDRLLEMAGFSPAHWQQLSTDASDYARQNFEMARVTRPVFEHLSELAAG